MVITMKRQMAKREQYEKLRAACEPFRRAKSETIRTLGGIGRRYRMLRYPVWIVLVAYIFIYNVILYGCIQWKVREKTARGIALVTTAALVFTSVDFTVFAAVAGDGNGTKEQGVITAFADLEESLAAQSLPTLSEESEIRFPETLTVMLETTSEEETAAPEEGTVSQNLVPDGTDGSSSQPVTAGAAEPDGRAVPMELSIAVAWENSTSDSFDSSAAGNCYVYLPVIPEDYTVAEGVSLPQIVVTIEEPVGEIPAEEGSVEENSAGLFALLKKLPDPLTYLASGEPDEAMIDLEQLSAAREALDEWLAESGADDAENNSALSGEDRERLSELIRRLEGLEHIRDTETDCMDEECPYHYPEMIQQRMAENEIPQMLTLADLVEEYGVEIPNAPIAVQTFAVQNTVTHPQTLMLTEDNENNSHTGKADGDIDVIMSSWKSVHPIELAFTLDELPTQSAYLAIKAYDVDEDLGETDYVYLNDDIYLPMDQENSHKKKYNNETIGYLAGTNNTWNTTVLEIPLDKLKKGKNVISVTVASSWVVTVDWMQLILDGGAADPNIQEFSLKLQNAVTEDGQVTVESLVTVRQTGNKQYTTEYVLTQEETGNALDACFGQVQATEEIALGMPLDSPSGVYKITGILKDPTTEEIKATDSVSFYFMQGLGIGPKVSYTLSPDVLTKTDVEITVSAEAVPEMGITDVTVPETSRVVSENGEYSFNINYKLNGNDTSASYKVKVDNIDKTAPTITYSTVTVLEDEAQATVEKLFAEALSVSDNRKLADEHLSYTIPTDISNLPGEKTVTVTATDAVGNKSTKNCTITVTAKPLELKLGELTAVSGSKDRYSLKATLTHTGADTIKETGFVWGIVPAPTLELNNGKVTTSSVIKTKNEKLSATATELVSGVEYYARAYAKVTASDGSTKVIYSETEKFGFGIPSYGTFSLQGIATNSIKTTFTIKRTGGTDGKQTVYYRTVNGSAIGGTHFNHVQGKVTFADGETSKEVTVTENKGVTNAYNNKEGTRYSNEDRTYSLEIYRVEGGGKIDETKRSKTRTMTKSSSYGINREIYTTEKLNIDQTEVSTTSGKKIQDSTKEQGATNSNVCFRINRDNVENYHTERKLSDYYTNSNQLAYLNATASGWYYRYQLKAYEGADGYEHAYMGKSEVPKNGYFDLKKNGNVAGDGVVTGVSGQLWACNFQLADNKATTFLFPSTEPGGGVGATKPTRISGTTYSYNNNTWVKLGVDETCYAYFGASGKQEDSWYLDGLTSYVMVQDEKEPQLLGVAPMAGGTYLPGDPITVALVFDEIVDSQNSSLSGLTITTNVGTLTYAGGADTNVLYFTGTVSSSVNLSGSSALQVTGISNASSIKDMCSLSGTSQTFPGGSTNVTVDNSKPTVTITPNTSGSLPRHQATITATNAKTIQYTWTKDASLPAYGWQTTTSGTQLTESRGTAGKTENWYLHVLATASSGAFTHKYQAFTFTLPTITEVAVRAGSSTSSMVVADVWKPEKYIVVQYEGAQTSGTKITFAGPKSSSYTVTSPSGTTSLQVTKNGTYTVTLTDGYGSVISKTIEVQKIDALKPTVTIRSGSSTAADTVYPELTLAVLPEDTGGSGVAKVEYAWTGTTAAPSAWTVLTADADGRYQAEYAATETAKTAKYLQVRVTDGAGNVSTVIRSGPYYMMKPATGAGLPSITVTGNPAAWEKSAVLTWTAKKGTGTGAGEIASVYTPGGAQTGDFIASVTTGTCTVTKNGVYVFQVTDQYGNSGRTEALVTTIDNEAPKLEKLECSVSTDRKTGTIKLTGATDHCTAVYDEKGNCTGYSGSGIQTRQYRMEGEDTWTAFTGDSFAVTENGKYVVRLEDHLGNISKEYSVEMKDIFKDTQEPSLAAAMEKGVSANADGWYNAAALHITLTYSDNVGVEKLYGKVDDGDFAEISGISTASGTIFTKTYDCTEGVHTYTFKAEDAAGNATTSDPVIVKWDKTKPVIGEITFEQKAASILDWIIGKESLILCIPVTEEGSGAEEISYTITSTSGMAQAATAKLNKDGLAKIVLSADWKGKITDIRCTDAAGNVSDTKSITGAANGIIVENNPPEITFTAADMTDPANPKQGEGLSENYYEETAVPTVYVLVTDADDAGITAGINDISYTINSGAPQKVNGSFDTALKESYGFAIPLAGKTGIVNITVNASDYAGNTAENTVVVRIKEKEEKPAPASDYRKEQITGLIPGAAYVVERETLSADGQGIIAIKESWFGSTIRISKKGTDNTSDSDEAELAIAKRPEIPSVSAGDETIKGKKDGTLSGVSATMEYSIDGGANWIPVDSGEITGGGLSGLAAGEILVRVKATDTAPHGEQGQITIAEGRTLTVAFDANGGSTVTLVAGKEWQDTVSRPQDPVKEGYVLDGWYRDNTFTIAWHFAGETDEDYLTQDVTLYAKWRDVAKPELDAVPADHKDAGKWYRELDIQLTYSDNEGVTGLSVQKDGGAYTELAMESGTPQGSRQYQLLFDGLEEGEHTYTFKAVDAAGNETVTDALTAKLDTTKPQLGDAAFNEGYKNFWNWIIRKDSLEITVPIIETGSGIDNVNYTLIPETGNAENSGTTGQATVKKVFGGENADYTAVIYVAPDFKGKIRIAATDNVGNVSDTKTIGTDGSGIHGVIVEDNAPEITFSVNGSAALAEEYEEVPTVAVTVKDDGENAVSAGLASVTYRVNNGAENTLQEDFVISLKTEAAFTIPAEKIPSDVGEITIVVRATDNAGNQSEKSLTVRIHTGGTIVDPPEPPGPPKPTETPKPTEIPKPTETPKPSASPRPTPDTSEAGQIVEESSGRQEGQPSEKEDAQSIPAATDQGKDMADTGTTLKLGDGTVIVRVVCDEQGYTAEVADTAAVADAVLTPEQMQIVTGGETIEIRIDVKDISGNVSERDKSVIENGMEEYRKEMPELTLGMYVDISIFMKIGEGDWNAVARTQEPVEVVIGIPDELQSDGRTFYIIRAHEGQYTLLADMDDEPDTITICTDMFSTYAIAYEQVGGQEKTMSADCVTCVRVWLAVILAVVLSIWIVLLRNRGEKEEREES